MAIKKERECIEATRRICSFKVRSRSGHPIAPIEIRLEKDRLSLIARVLASTDDAYKHSQVMLELANKLGVPGDRGYVYVTHSHHKHRSGIESEDSTFIDPGRSHIGYVALTLALLNYVADIQCRRYQGTTFQALWS